jgi:SNF2 family DNA or RNA helicase
MVMVKTSPFQWMPKRNATMLVNIALQPAIRFTKSECLDLPPVTYQTRTVSLTPLQWQCYEEIKNEKFLPVEGGSGVSAVHAAAAMTKLLQVSCGAVYADSGDVVKFDGRNRLREVVDIVNGTLNKVVVFVPFRHAITILADKLKSEGINTEIVNGAVTARKRADIFHAFQTTDDPRVLVIQPQSAAHGITLTAADTIVWFGPIASVETWLQANERINRPPQKNKMTIIKICGSPIERRVYKALESKESQHKMLTRIYEEERDDSGY